MGNFPEGKESVEESSYSFCHCYVIGTGFSRYSNRNDLALETRVYTNRTLAMFSTALLMVTFLLLKILNFLDPSLMGKSLCRVPGRTFPPGKTERIDSDLTSTNRAIRMGFSLLLDLLFLFLTISNYDQNISNEHSHLLAGRTPNIFKVYILRSLGSNMRSFLFLSVGNSLGGKKPKKKQTPHFDQSGCVVCYSLHTLEANQQ